MAENTIKWDKDADGIVTLTLDDPTGSANVMNEHYSESMTKAVERLVSEQDSITGVVITSAKKTFFAGGDLKGMINLGPDNAGEAFASVVLKFQKDLDIPDEKLNVNGGAIAMGHPLGATGAMITGTMVDELERRNARRALVTLCIGGGMGVATIIERV